MLLTPLLSARTIKVPINHLINQTTFQLKKNNNNNTNSNRNNNSNSSDGARFYNFLNNNLKPSQTISAINLFSNSFDKIKSKISANDMLMNASEINNLFITQRIKKNNSNSSYIPYWNNSKSIGGHNHTNNNNDTNFNSFIYNNYSANLDSERYNKKQRSDLYLVRTNLEKNISYVGNKSNSNSAVNSKVIDASNGDGKKLQITLYDILFATIVFSLIGVLILSLIGVVRCLRATRESSGALALPKTVLSEDRTPLNSETNNTVPMLSVQSPGCAGMERLGIPARSSYGSPSVRDNRGHSCRLRSESTSLQSCDISTIPSNRQKMKSFQDINHHRHNTNIEVISCPHHVPLADGEWGPDRDLQLRTPYQQTEITRTYIKAPPNKTAFDIPEQSYNLFSSTSSCNLNSHRSLNSIHMSSNTSSSNISISPATSVATGASATAAGTNQKSKANAITKFLLRISSNSKSTDNQSSQQQHNSISHQQQQHTHHHHHHHHHQQHQLLQQHQNYNIKNNSNSSLNSTSISSTVVVQQQNQQIQYQQQGFGSTNQNINNNNINNNINNHNNNSNSSDTNSNNSYSHQQTDS